tara:strand:+ start:86 stop:475 length:390 start_codon:yes stop_codon:yes gene_type:complete
MITGTYASLLALIVVILSFRVIALRGIPALKWFAFGNDGEESLQRAIRGQGNLIEYAPIFLILMLVAELGGLKENTLHSYGIAFLVARLMHGLCFGFLKHSMILRFGGSSLTLISILGLAVLVLMRYAA